MRKNSLFNDAGVDIAISHLSYNSSRLGSSCRILKPRKNLLKRILSKKNSGPKKIQNPYNLGKISQTNPNDSHATQH